jgi:hypothetical protein
MFYRLNMYAYYVLLRNSNQSVAQLFRYVSYNHYLRAFRFSIAALFFYCFIKSFAFSTIKIFFFSYACFFFASTFVKRKIDDFKLINAIFHKHYLMHNRARIFQHLIHTFINKY